MPALTFTIPVRRSDSTIASDLKDATVIMDIDAEVFYELNPVAARIWELLEQQTTPERICQQLQTEYTISAEACQTEVMVFLESLVQRSLLEIG